MIIVKNRDAAYHWATYHKDLTSAAYSVYLSLNYAQSTNSTVAKYWNSTAPTSTVFSVGASNTYTNTASNKQIAYCFHSVEGYSSIGKYTGNGSADGPFVYTGFRPAWLMIKKATGSVNANAGWILKDATRDIDNVVNANLQAESTGAEYTSGSEDFLSNGFKIRTNNIGQNTSGSEYIYMAFAENPFKNALAR